MSPMNVDDIYALTPMQRLMLVHALMSPGPGVLANQVCYEIDGNLRTDAFRRAWEALVTRHAALRTAILWDGLEQPVQVVRTHVEVPFVEVDLANHPAEVRSARVEELKSRDRQAAFDLTRAPLMRCTLIRLGEDRHYFIWNIHHLVVDRWSHGTLFADLRALYAALIVGDAAELAPPVEFRDYVAWLAQQEEGTAERFWREELGGFGESTTLATKTPPAGEEGRLLTRHLVATETTAGLEAQAATWKTTLAAIVLAGVGLETSRLTGSTDVVFGLTVSGRPPGLDRVEHAVGSFVSNVPLRFQVEAKRPLAECVRAVQLAQIRRQPFEHVSLATIRDWTELPPSQDLFDTLVVLNLDPPADARWPDVKLKPVAATLDAGYPLVLGVTKDGDRIELNLVHDVGFPGATALLEGVERTLDAFVGATPQSAVGDVLPLPGRSEANAEQARPPADRLHAPEPRGTGRAGLRESISGIWAEVLGVEAVGLDDDFFALGGTSLQAARIFIQLERLTGQTLPLSTLIDASTIRALLAALDEPAEPTGPVVAIRSTGTRPALFTIPGIGGNVVGLSALARALGPAHPFFGLESRGLDGKEEVSGSIETIAEDFVQQMIPTAGQEFHLLGVCWGAAVAFEMAVRLASRGHPPKSLSLLDPAVLLREDDSSSTNTRLRFLTNRLEMYWDEFRESDWRGRGRMVARKARMAAGLVRSGGMTPSGHLELNQLRVRDANREAVTHYRPVVLASQARVFLTEDRELGSTVDPRLEWLDLIEPRPEIAHVPGADSGDALFANAAGFAKALGAWLDEVDQVSR